MVLEHPILEHHFAQLLPGAPTPLSVGNQVANGLRPSMVPICDANNRQPALVREDIGAQDRIAEDARKITISSMQPNPHVAKMAFPKDWRKQLRSRDE